MNAPGYSIPAVDRRGLGTYEPDLSSMPPAPAGYVYVVVPGQIFPQLQKQHSGNGPLIGLAVLVAAGWWFFSGKRVSITREVFD